MENSYSGADNTNGAQVLLNRLAKGSLRFSWLHHKELAAATGFLHTFVGGSDGFVDGFALNLYAAPAKQNRKVTHGAELEVPQLLGDLAQAALCSGAAIARADQEKLFGAGLAGEIGGADQGLDQFFHRFSRACSLGRQCDPVMDDQRRRL